MCTCDCELYERLSGEENHGEEKMLLSIKSELSIDIT